MILPREYWLEETIKFVQELIRTTNADDAQFNAFWLNVAPEWRSGSYSMARFYFHLGKRVASNDNNS